MWADLWLPMSLSSEINVLNHKLLSPLQGSSGFQCWVASPSRRAGLIRGNSETWVTFGLLCLGILFMPVLPASRSPDWAMPGRGSNGHGETGQTSSMVINQERMCPARGQPLLAQLMLAGQESQPSFSLFCLFGSPDVTNLNFRWYLLVSNCRGKLHLRAVCLELSVARQCIPSALQCLLWLLNATSFSCVNLEHLGSVLFEGQMNAALSPCAFTCTFVQVCAGKRTTSVPLLRLLSFETSSLTVLELTKDTEKLQGPSCLYLFRVETTSRVHHTWLFLKYGS